MKEFKFACPVCGQHITAASGTTGAQIECPTCFQKIVVPQERTDDTKLIINAAIADRPRAPQTLTAAPVPAPRQGRGSGGVLALFLVLLLVAVAGYVARERLFGPRPKSVQTITNAPSAVVPAVVKAGADWTMDPTRVKIPREPAGGSVHGAGFSLTRATLQGGLLSLRQGKGWPPELAVAIQFPAKRGEDLAEKHVVVLPEQAPPVPRVTMRWKNEQGKSVTKGFASNYLLRLEFGRAKEGKMSGEIYLALPDENQSYVAGTFMAEIRAPVAPKKGKR